MLESKSFGYVRLHQIVQSDYIIFSINNCPEIGLFVTKTKTKQKKTQKNYQR